MEVARLPGASRAPLQPLVPANCWLPAPCLEPSGKEVVRLRSHLYKREALSGTRTLDPLLTISAKEIAEAAAVAVRDPPAEFVASPVGYAWLGVRAA